ncbi:cysteine hydrolase family protein [Nocardia tengchongensis]
MVTNLVVLMIDVQNGYIADDRVRDVLGWPPIWRLDEVLAECADLLTAARASNIPVVYSRAVTSAAGILAANPRAVRHQRSRISQIPTQSAVQREWRTQIIDTLAPAADDLVLEKTRPSFFTYTELDPVLKSLGAQRLLIAGLQTNVCVEATARAALDHNYEVAVAEDAVSTDGPALHYGSLDSMRVLYVEVAPWRELIAADDPWDRAFTTPNYGRDPGYWDETTISAARDEDGNTQHRRQRSERG